MIILEYQVKPSESEIISATIISDYSIDADGLSTGVYIIGIEKSIKIIESLKGIDAIFITRNKENYTTSDITGKFAVINDEFTLKNNIRSKEVKKN